nr:Sua5/YciO/YrdC/YwlC family protein [Gammaproteobacteria bacterium]
MRMSSWPIQRARSVLRAGGIVAYPTEAVYGLGCDPWNADALTRLLTLKRRGVEKGVILIAAAVSQLRPFVAELDESLRRRIEACWPGSTTWLVPSRKNVPFWLTGGRKTVAVRVTAHRQAACLCEAYGGALVSTSANIAGRPPARSALGVRRQFGVSIDYVLSGRVGGDPQPTEIRDALSDRVIRPRGS